ASPPDQRLLLAVIAHMPPEAGGPTLLLHPGRAAACPVDGDGDIHLLLRAAIARAAYGGRPEIVEADTDTDMCLGRTDPMGGVETDPTEIFDIGLDPGMPCFLLRRVVRAQQIAADIAGGNAEAAGTGDKNMREILADAVLHLEGLGGRGTDCGQFG